MSLAELAARLRLHLNVVRVLVGDLHTRQLLTVHVPRAAGSSDLDILEKGDRWPPRNPHVRRARP